MWKQRGSRVKTHFYHARPNVTKDQVSKFNIKLFVFISGAIILQTRHSFSISTVTLQFLYRVYDVLHQVLYVFINQVSRVFYIRKERIYFDQNSGKEENNTHFVPSR